VLPRQTDEVLLRRYLRTTWLVEARGVLGYGRWQGASREAIRALGDSGDVNVIVFRV